MLNEVVSTLDRRLQEISQFLDESFRHDESFEYSELRDASSSILDRLAGTIAQYHAEHNRHSRVVLYNLCRLVHCTHVGLLGASRELTGIGGGLMVSKNIPNRLMTSTKCEYCTGLDR